MNKRGFTLIELLVTISIITILATIGIAVFSTVQKNNRDQIRMRDLQAIKQALELYRSDNGSYPTTSTDLIDKYLTAWPTDPLSNQFYKYIKTSSTEFVVCAKKEGNMESTTLPGCLMARAYCASKSQNCNIGLQSD